MPKTRFLTLSIVCAAAILSLGLLMPFRFIGVEAEDCCTPQTLSPLAGRFSPNAPITVTVDSRYITEPERQLIEQAFRRWNSLNAVNGSGITYTGFQFSDTEPPPGSNNTHWVTYRDEELYMNNTPAAAITRLIQESVNGQPVVRAVTTLSPAIRRGWNQEVIAAYFSSVMKHEIGHGLGLEHNDNCPPGTTIMNAPVSGGQDITPCDSNAVGSLYPAPLYFPECDPSSVSLCETSGGFVNPVTCICQGVTIYYDPYYGGGPCHDTYSCTPAYTGVWIDDPEIQGGGYWDMEFDSWACYYEGCY